MCVCVAVAACPVTSGRDRARAPLAAPAPRVPQPPVRSVLRGPALCLSLAVSHLPPACLPPFPPLSPACLPLPPAAAPRARAVPGAAGALPLPSPCPAPGGPAGMERLQVDAQALEEYAEYRRWGHRGAVGSLGRGPCRIPGRDARLRPSWIGCFGLGGGFAEPQAPPAVHRRSRRGRGWCALVRTRCKAWLSAEKSRIVPRIQACPTASDVLWEAIWSTSGIPAHGRGAGIRWSLRSRPNHTIIW